MNERETRGGQRASAQCWRKGGQGCGERNRGGAGGQPCRQADPGMESFVTGTGPCGVQTMEKALEMLRMGSSRVCCSSPLRTAPR